MINGNLLYVLHPEGWRPYGVSALPFNSINTFEQIFSVSGLQCRPQLVWLHSAGGAGGFHSPGLVAIGERDLEEITTFILNTYFAWRRTDPRFLFRPQPLSPSRARVRAVVERVLLAHELGHARQAESASGLMGLVAENDADVFTGRIAQKLGWDSTLDRHVMHAIGCRGERRFCTHASPTARVQLYDNGRLFVQIGL